MIIDLLIATAAGIALESWFAVIASMALAMVGNLGREPGLGLHGSGLLRLTLFALGISLLMSLFGGGED